MSKVKKQVIAVLAGLTLLATVLGTSGIIADSLGWQVTPQMHACSGPGGSGGDC
jgi:hypothetical protein